MALQTLAGEIVTQFDTSHPVSSVETDSMHACTRVYPLLLPLIIRSEKSGGFNEGRYNLETSEYYESLGPRQTPTEMFPQR